MKKTLILLLGLWLITLPAAAQNEQTIALTDGTVLKGQVVSLSNGVYKIQTSNLGTVDIKEGNIQSISKGPPSASTGGQINQLAPAFAQQTQHMQQQIMSDPAIMKSIQALTNNPELMKILQDPKVMQDLMSMDEAAIKNNAGIQKLIHDPEMQQIIGNVQAKFSPPTP